MFYFVFSKNCLCFFVHEGTLNGVEVSEADFYISVVEVRCLMWIPSVGAYDDSVCEVSDPITAYAR